MISSSWTAATLLLPFLPYTSATYSYPSSTPTNATIPLPTSPCGITPVIAWPSDLPGVPYTSQAPDAELTSILEQVDPLRIQAIIEKLVSFGTRHTQSSQTDPERGIGAARDWILKEYQGYAEASEGQMTVKLQSYIQGVGGRISAPTNIRCVYLELDHILKILKIPREEDISRIKELILFSPGQGV